MGIVRFARQGDSVFNVKKKCFYAFILAFVFLVSAPASFARQEKSRLKGHRYVPGEVLVKFRSGVSKHIARATHRFFGSRRIKRFRRIKVDHVKIPHGWTVEDAIEMYQWDPDVEYVEPNYIRRITAQKFPNDKDNSDFGESWGLHNTGQAPFNGIEDADIDAPEAWDTLTDCTNVVIAVLDSGVDWDHEDLAGNIWSNDDEVVNGVDTDGNGYVDDIRGWDFASTPNDNNPDDDNGHGTHVAGIIAAEANNECGSVGVCWTANIMVIKIAGADGKATVDREVAGIQYAISNDAKIINLSMGGKDASDTEKNAIKDARDAGVLFVAAAGNGRDDNDGANPEYPASYDLENIISVAATDYDDELTDFSNYGATSVDVAAPGKSIYSTLRNDGYASWDGTSMATPFVAGLAGLIWHNDITLTYSQVKGLILNGVDELPVQADKEKIATGGRINADTSLGLLVPPSGPTDLSAATLSLSQINLTWINNADDEIGVKIERKEGAGGTYSHLTTIVGVNVESHRDEGLTEATTYYYRVYAYNNNGNSTYSNQASDTTYPAAPSGLSATAVSSSQINLSWTDNSSGETGFRIERKTGSGGTYSQIATVGSNVTFYGSTGLSASTTYYYRVRAYNAGGNSTYSYHTSARTSSSDGGNGGGGNGGGGGSGGGGGGGGGCFIATAAYGSAYHPYVKTLKEFRDIYLLPSETGKQFVTLYYRYSPPVAELITRHAPLKYLARILIIPLIGFSVFMLYACAVPTLFVLLALMLAARREPLSRSASWIIWRGLKKKRVGLGASLQLE